MSELDDIALDADNPVFEAEPVRIAPIVEQFAFPKVMKWHATVLSFSEMMHETNIVIPKGELSISVSDSTLDGQPAVYCMVTFKSMYASTPQWIKEDIFKQERSIKIDSFPDETHISVGTFPIRYKPALLEVIDRWKKNEGSSRVENKQGKVGNVKSTSSHSGAVDGSLSAQGTPKIDVKIMFKAHLSINETVLPDPTETGVRGGTSYMIDLTTTGNTEPEVSVVRNGGRVR
jgi:hypothetical protein